MKHYHYLALGVAMLSAGCGSFTAAPAGKLDVSQVPLTVAKGSGGGAVVTPVTVTNTGDQPVAQLQWSLADRHAESGNGIPLVLDNPAACSSIDAHSSCQMNLVVIEPGHAVLIADAPPKPVQPYAQFQRFDDQIAIGNSWDFGLLSNGQVFQNDNIALKVSKLFDNGVYVNLGGTQAYDSTYINYAANSVAAQVGYGFAIDERLLIIPNVLLTRSQFSSYSSSNNLNDILYSGIAGVKLEYLPLAQLKLSANAGYGIVGQNATLNNSDGATVYGGSINAGAGISYQPLKDIPWLLNADYSYNSYAGGLLGQSNSIVVSTGYAF